MRISTIIILLFTTSIISFSCSDNKTLDRNKAEKIFQEQEFTCVVLKKRIHFQSEDAKILIKNAIVTKFSWIA